jgi:hypothetical protein
VLQTIGKDHSFIHEEIKSRLNSGNPFYFLFRFLSPLQNLKIKIYKTMILLVCMGVKFGLSH